MLIFIVGGVLAALGLAAAGVLMAAALGLAGVAPGWSMWVLFPLFTLLGWSLLVVGSRDPAVRAPTRWLAIPLLLLALVAAIALVAGAAGLWVANGTATLWYVLVMGGVLGAVGSAVPSRSA